MPIGIICIEWSKVEMILSLSYSLLVFGDRSQLDTAEVIVIDAFESLASWEKKIELLVDAADERLGSVTSKKLGRLLRKQKPIQQRRNNAVHGRWFTSKDAPGKWIRRKRLTRSSEVYDPEWFHNLISEIRSMQFTLWGFFQKEIRPLLEGGPYIAAAEELVKPLQSEKN